MARFWLVAALASASCSREYTIVPDPDLVDAGAPIVRVEPTLLDYGLVDDDETGLLTFLVANDGDAPLELGNLVLGGSTAFTILQGPDTPALLDPGGEVTVDVAYHAQTEADVGFIVVTSNDDEAPEVRVDLLGGWSVPRIALDPWTYDFGSLPPFCVEQQHVTIQSVGTGVLVVDAVDFAGDGLTFLGAPELPLELAPGEETTVYVTFAPVEEGLFSGTLQVTSNDPLGAATSTLLGSGSDDGTCEGAMTFELAYEVDYKVADIAFLIDTTCSMGATANAMASEFAMIAADLAVEIPDVTFGVAQFDDYNHLGFGSGADKPFFLKQQQTSDTAAVQWVLDHEIAIHYGADLAESTMEALQQAATGAGYDQDADGAYDAVDDVPPFIANPYDAFGGTVAGLYDSSVVGTGDRGGMGFRDDVLPIFIAATDAPLRDPDAGYATPGGLPFDASFFTVYTALDALQAKFIGVGVEMTPAVSAGWDQLEDLAIVTDSTGDMDGDGVDEPAVVAWSGTDAQFRTAIVDAVLGLTGNAHFDKVSLVVASDPLGLVLDVEPDAYYDLDAGDPIAFTLTVGGTKVDDPATAGAEPVVLHLVAEDTLILAIDTIYVVP